jgi:hypothetical protein
MEQPIERAASAIVRAWIEAGETDGLRVRITEVLDLDDGIGRTHPAVTTIEEACAIVARWLAGFATAPSDGEGSGDGEGERPPR